MNFLKGKTLRDAIISGANHIANNRQQVDALNVFPVPDGDTGTNMSMTISAAKRELERLDDDATIEEVSKTAASALLRGARGNSGVILSLLFRGFSKGLAGKNTAAPADIANALSLGVEAAYKAVMKPTEGTILTVSRAAAEKARETAGEAGKDVARLWCDLTQAASEMLEKTPEMLPVLKKAGVVDAGGKGLLVVFEGMASVIRDDVIIPLAGAVSAPARQESVTAAFFEDDDGFSGEITFTYCTEFIILRGEGEKSPLALRAFLETIGDCVVVVDDDEIIKVHVHTDHPGKAMEEALSYGMLTKLKVDNMRLQFADKVSNAQKAAKAEAQRGNLPYAAPDPDRPFGFVAVAAGEGVRQLFLDLGVDQVVSGGQTMNPSTDDILSAVQSVGAQTVFVLPNNKNIIMAAEQSVSLADRQVIVLQTKTIPQGLSAMLAFDAEQDVDQNFLAMSRAAGHVATGQITFAARDSDFDGHKIKQGEILALEEGKVAFVEKDLIKAANKLAKTIIRKDSTFVTVLYGEGATEEQAGEVEKYIHAKFGDDLEVAVINGGQPVYYFILSAE
ncbi:DAK2 domain-containing protein [Yanshouia hominis]|uniref:DAK2 domain-containing protein n=1 Tax=Yanshouia hominis TaxID=2763673 RepID=A0ABR7NGJ1_9FIRM|nr:DAK2 domain-containing protein [Yanshouia hominis]MBC8575527.1 DAK2 domain-containing protein [Yanshouia hominis]